MVYMIARAKDRGATWAVIGSALGARNGKHAKAIAKRLARSTQSEMLVALMEAGDAGESVHAG